MNKKSSKKNIKFIINNTHIPIIMTKSKEILFQYTKDQFDVLYPKNMEDVDLEELEKVKSKIKYTVNYLYDEGFLDKTAHAMLCVELGIE